jgi:non-ribosomal peptide synthetase component E (peptide arylation enzyme)
VVPRDPQDPPDLATLRGHVGETLASFKRPDGLTLLADLPVTPMFKVDKRALRALFQEDLPSTAPPPSPS